MDKEHDLSRLAKCIEVKGMKGLSLAYIQRFFGHVGVVQEVKRIQDLIIVRFKNQNSVNKALRYNGRVIDKQAIKIRSATTMQQFPHKKIVVNNNLSNFYDELDKRIKDQVFDLPFIWANVLKIINKLQNDKLIWLLHEIFFIKMSQIIHFHAFGTNPRSHYSQITIKDIFLYDAKNNVHLIQDQGSIKKLEILTIPSNQLLDQPNFQCFLASVDTRLKLKFYQLLKFTQGQRLYQLYSLFNTYSLYIPNGQSIFSSESTLLSNNYSFSVSKQLVTQRRARISLLDTQQSIKRRSQYREIDNKHPNKQIQIFSDSCLNQNILQKTTYDIFRDDFDGSLTNSCAADIFFAYRMHFVSNFIVVRVKQLGKLNYYRLCFQLRIMHCQGQIMGAHDCTQYMFWNRNREFQQIIQLKLLKHNLVISDFEQIQRIVYSLQNYLRFFLPQVSFKQPTKQNQQPIISLIIILQNPIQQNIQKLTHLAKQLTKNENLKQSIIKIYIIKFISYQKCKNIIILVQKLKCHNFIQQYINKQKGTFNYQIAKFHAKQIITQNPSKFKHIEGVQQYITEVLWKLGQDKNKREIQNRVRVQLHNVRMQ